MITYFTQVRVNCIICFFLIFDWNHHFRHCISRPHCVLATCAGVCRAAATRAHGWCVSGPRTIRRPSRTASLLSCVRQARKASLTGARIRMGGRAHVIYSVLVQATPIQLNVPWKLLPGPLFGKYPKLWIVNKISITFQFHWGEAPFPPEDGTPMHTSEHTRKKTLWLFAFITLRNAQISRLCVYLTL